MPADDASVMELDYVILGSGDRPPQLTERMR